MKAINAAMKSFFSLFNRHFDKIKGRRIYEHYKFTLQCILSDFFRVTSLPRLTYRQSSTERRMTSLRELPGVFLSTTRARWLVARNSSEDQLLKEKACMIDRSKRKEERAFQREKIEVIECQKRTNQTYTPLRYSRFDLDQKCKCKDLQE